MFCWDNSLQEAIDVYTKAAALKPNDPGPYLNRAVAYDSLKQVQQPTKTCTKRSASDPRGDAQPLCFSPDFYMNKGDNQKARRR